MCPSLGEGFKSPKLCDPYHVSRIPCRHFVLCKVASKTIYTFSLTQMFYIVLVREFVVMVNLSGSLWAHP